MTITVQQLGANLGAEIVGADLSQSLSDPDFSRIREAFHKHQVLLFRDQDITTEQQMAFGRRFGELSIHPFSPAFEDKPEVIILDYNKDNPPALTDIWHSDETFRADPPMATILRARVVPPIGGNTAFASMTAAYDGLSDRMKGYIQGLRSVHDFKPFRTLFGDDPEGRAKIRALEDKYPTITHPIVTLHPETKKKVLFVNPQFSIRIPGLSAEESDMILNFLFRQADTPEYQFRVDWRPHTLVIWDNRAVQHYALHDYYPEPRSMERVTIKGVVPLGDLDNTMVDGPNTKAGYGENIGDGAVRRFETEI